MPRLPQTLFSTAIASTFLLAACSATKPHEYSEDETRQRIIRDQAQMYANQEPVTKPITFYEAAARALKYNLDYRLKLMESALASDLRDVSSHEMLPRLVASAGYAGRNNDSGVPPSVSRTARKACAHPPPKNAIANSMGWV